MSKNLTIKEAKEKGYEIDEICYPHVGYKGPRFNPIEIVEVYTKLETELKDALIELGANH